jgi:hypothetical protein
LSETFVDDNSRAIFHNAHEYPRLYSEDGMAPVRYCAPRLDRGYEVEGIRRRLAQRAGFACEPDVGGMCGCIDVVSVKLRLRPRATTRGSDPEGRDTGLSDRANGEGGPYFSGLFCFSSGITDLLLFGIVSRPWSPLASLPPEVDVPLPLLFGAMPVVSVDPLDAEFAAGRGVPGPPALLCAYASELDRTKAVAKKTAESFIAWFPFDRQHRMKTATAGLCSDLVILPTPCDPMPCDLAEGPAGQLTS